MTSLKGNRYLTFFISALVDMVAFIAVVFIVRKYVAVNFLNWKILRYLLCTGSRTDFFLRWALEARFDSVDIWVFPQSCRCQRRIPLLVFFVIGGVACIIAGIIPFICKTTNCTYFSFTNTSIIIYIGYIFIVVLSFHFFGGFFMLLKVWKFSLAKHLILQWRTRICEGRLS